MLVPFLLLPSILHAILEPHHPTVPEKGEWIAIFLSYYAKPVSFQ